MSFEWLTMNLENNFIPKGNIFNIDIFIYSGSGSEHPTTESFDRILEVSQALEYQLPDSIHPESEHHLPLEPENLPPSENNLSPSLDQQETDLPLPPPPEDLPAIPADIFLLDNGSDENWPLPPMPEDFPPITDASLPSPDLPPPPLDTSTFTGRSLEPIFHSLSPPSVYQTEDPMIPDEPNIGSIMLNVLSNLEANSEEVVPPFRIFGSAFDEEIAAEIVAGQDRVTGQDARQRVFSAATSEILARFINPQITLRVHHVTCRPRVKLGAIGLNQNAFTPDWRTHILHCHGHESRPHQLFGQKEG